MDLLQHLDPNLMAMYVAQAKVSVADWEFGRNILLIAYGVFVGIIYAIHRLIQDKDTEEMALILVGLIGGMILLFSTLGVCSGYENYITAKANPEYWAYKKLLGVLSKF